MEVHLFSSIVPWQCRGCVGSCCLYDREWRTGGHRPDEAACRAAGSRLLPNTRPGGRSACSGGSRTAVFYCTSGHKKCLADDMGCCCVPVKQRRSVTLIAEIYTKVNQTVSSGEKLPRAFPCTISEWGTCKVDTSLHCGSCETLNERDKCWENITDDRF